MTRVGVEPESCDQGSRKSDALPLYPLGHTADQPSVTCWIERVVVDSLKQDGIGAAALPILTGS